MRARVILTAALLAAVLPARAETLRVAAVAVPPSLGNPYTATGLPSAEIWTALFDGLTRLDWLGGPQPGLALSWDNPTPNRWVFRLRPGAAFHSGRPVTADAVARVFALLAGPEASGYLIPRELDNIASVIPVDDTTLELILAKPDPILPKRLSTVMIVDPDAWVERGAERGADGFARAPVGSGPYQLESWGAGNANAELRAFPASWRAPKAFDRVLYRAVPEKSSRLQALLGGQADVATGLGVDDIPEIEQAGFVAHPQKTTQVNSVALPNVRDGDHPLKDARVRRALNYAVDKDAIARSIMAGAVDVASQGAVPGIPGFNPTLAPYPYDPARARALLAEAGYPDGFKLAIEIMVMFMPLDAVMYQKVAEDLRAVGVEATVRAIPFADFIRKYTANQWGAVDAFAMGWNNAAYQDAVRPLEYFSCLRVNPFFCDPDTARELETVLAEADPSAREAGLKRVMARVHDLAPAIWLVNSVYVNAAAPAVGDFRMTQNGVVFEDLTRSSVSRP